MPLLAGRDRGTGDEPLVVVNGDVLIGDRDDEEKRKPRLEGLAGGRRPRGDGL